jgi:hypothetical protein
MTVGDRQDWLLDLLDLQIANGVCSVTAERWWRRW